MPSPEELESQIDRLLRRQPDRPAPAGLETRVLAELARRAALPWWKRSYASWPAWARLLFFVGSAIAAAAVIFTATRAFGGSSAWLGGGNDLFSDLSGAAESAYRHVPLFWLYGVVGALAITYGALIGAGSLLYRSLLVRPSTFSP